MTEQEKIDFQMRVAELASASQKWVLEMDPAGKNHTELVRSMIEDAELFFGVYNDPSEPLGFGMRMIKGFRKTMRARNTRKVEDARIGAIVVRSPEEAEAFRKTLGDHALKNDRAERDNALVDKAVANSELFEALVPSGLMDQAVQEFPGLPVEQMRRTMIEQMVRNVPEARARIAVW